MWTCSRVAVATLRLRPFPSSLSKCVHTLHPQQLLLRRSLLNLRSKSKFTPKPYINAHRFETQTRSINHLNLNLELDTVTGGESPNDPLDPEEERKEDIWARGPATLPTFNVAAYANDSDNAKRLVRFGVDLARWEGRYGTIPILYKTDFEKTMRPIITFLQDKVGLDQNQLAHVISANPYIFEEDVRNLGKRLEYLRIKRFAEDEAQNIIAWNPYWLSFSVPRIDRRLGFFQLHFGLSGAQVRQLACAGPSGAKLITYNLGRVKDVTFTVKEEMGFSAQEVTHLLLTRPRIFRQFPESLRRTFDYLHNEEKFPHDYFLRWPVLLLQRQRRMQERIGFLRSLGRAQFDATAPNYVSPEMLIAGVDAEFAEKVAKVTALQYNNYLKTL